MTVDMNQVPCIWQMVAAMLACHLAAGRVVRTNLAVGNAASSSSGKAESG